MIEVEGPDGSIYEFPDGTPNEVMKGAMAKRFGSPTKQQQPVAEPKKEETPWYKTAAKAFAYGVADTARQDASLTQKLGLGINPADIQKSVSDVAGLDTYEPGGKVAWDSNKPLTDRVSAIPKAVIESIPGLAQDVALGLGNPMGFMAAHAAKLTPDTIDAVRDADATDPNSSLTNQQMARVAASVGADAVLNRLGMKATFGNAGIQNVGAKALPEIAKSIGRAGLVDTGLTEAGIVADKGIIEGKAPSPSDLAVGAVMGGGSGIAGRSMPSIAEGATAFNYRGLNNLPERSTIVAAKALKRAQEGNPKADPTKGAAAVLDTHIDNFARIEGNKQLIKDTGIEPDLILLKQSLKRGETMDPEVFSRVEQAVDGLEQASPLIQALTDRNTFNQIKTDYYGEGLSDSTVARAANPNTRGANAARMIDSHLLWKAINGGKFGLLDKSLAAAQGMATAVPKLIDRMTGADDPTQVLIDRFANRTPPATTEPSMPYVSPRLEAKAKEKADAIAEKERVKAETVANKAKAKADKAKVSEFQDTASKKLGLLDRLEAEDAAKLAQSTKNVVGAVSKLDDPFMSQSARLHGDKDLGFEANLPPNPQYGSSSPLDLKKLAFNAKLLKRGNISGEENAALDRFQNGEVVSPLDIPMDDTMRTPLMERFLEHKLGTSADAEAARTRAEWEAENALIAQGLNPNILPTPGHTPVNRPKINREGAFPDPDLLQRPTPSTAPFEENMLKRQTVLGKRDAFLKKVTGATEKPQDKPKPSRATSTPKESQPFSVAFLEAPESDPIHSKRIGRREKEFFTTESKIRNKVMLAGKEAADVDSHWKGVENRVLEKEKAIDELKAVTPARHHAKLDKLEDAFLEQGMGKEVANKKLEEFIKMAKLVPATAEKVRAVYKKSPLSKNRHWTRSGKPK